MSKRKVEFLTNVINFVTRGDCGHEGLKYQFEDSEGVHYFSNVVEEDSPKKLLAEMFVNLKDPNDKGVITFEYIVPGKFREIKKVSVRHFMEYLY